MSPQQDASFFISLIAKLVVADSIQESSVGAGIEWIDQKITEYQGKFGLELTKDQISIIKNLVRQEVDIKVFDAPMLVDDAPFAAWYERSRLGGFWARFYKYISQKGLPENVVSQVDKDTDKILGRMADPKSTEGFNCRGMVVGDVQAGKTLNYSTLINKASDVGYKVIIVLTGVTESLRSQTQERLDFDYVGEISSVGNKIATSANFVGVGRIPSDEQLRVICRTDVNYDFKNPGRFSIDSVSQPILIVAKKNKSVLDEINVWINSQKNVASEKVIHPILIIDDEADNASVNTGNAGAEPKAINHGIRKILDSCSKITYVGYTATPFANIFISPDDSYDSADAQELFPKDFIISLIPPDNYCGGKFFFLDNNYEYEENIDKPKQKYKPLCDIEDAEEFFPKKMPVNGIPPSLKTALNQFLVASAIKDFRRSKGYLSSKGDNRFDSCLINISVRKSSQNTIKPIVKDYIDIVMNSISSSSSKDVTGGILKTLQTVFEEEFKGFLIDTLSWDDVYHHLKQLERPHVVSINTDSEDELKWTDTSPKKVVAIGGFTLSRGLTLSGLTVSYLYRNSKMFDTIMQMGRWFGYRDGYRDLVRLWTEPDFADSFASATMATEDLRADIVQMTKLKMTPRSFGMKVSSYPGLLPTAKNKMKNSEEIEVKVSFAGTKPEAHCFYVDETVEMQNQQRVSEFTESIKNKYQPVTRLGKSNIPQLAFESVDSAYVCKLLEEYKFHPLNKGRVAEDFFRKYIEELRYSELSSWDVIYYSHRKTIHGKSLNISNILNISMNSQPRSIFSKPFINNDHDSSCVHLTAHRTITPAGVADYVTRDDRATLVIQSLVAGEIDLEGNNDKGTVIPDHLQGVSGREFISLKIYFPKVTRDFKVVSCIASLDYIRRLKEEQSDESEVED
jgi:hypothetical protein